MVIKTSKYLSQHSQKKDCQKMSGTETGVEFNFSFAEGATREQILGFELAGEIWSQYLVDTFNGENLEINIHVEIADDLLPENIIGGAFPTIQTNLKYEDIYNALVNDVSSAADQIIVDNLLDASSIDILVGGEVTDHNYQMQATSANLKALGLMDGDNQELDGYIVMNSLESAPISWNYDFLHAPSEGTLDFLSTALHEVGHTIGFISGIDTSGTEDNSFIRRVLDYFGYQNTASVTETTVMDLFRYSLESAAQEVTDLTLGTAAFFSLDGTETELALSTGEDYQGSHWIDSTVDNGLGIMNPTLGLGERWSISGNDILVMDAIGWNVNYNLEFDLEALCHDTQSQVETAWIADRTSDIDSILNTEAYNWSRRSSTSSSSSFWQVGYWSTYDKETGEAVLIESPSTESTQDSPNNSHDHSSSWWWNTSWDWDGTSSWNWDSSWSNNDDDDDDDDEGDSDRDWSNNDDDDEGDNYSYQNHDDDDDDNDDD